MADFVGQEAPQTLEGWYVLHDVYALDWPGWQSLEGSARKSISAEAEQWLSEAPDRGKGDTAAYSILTQKGDLMFLHYRKTPEELNQVELSLRQLRLYEYLIPTYSFLSVIEISLYELTTIARMKLADQGITPTSSEYNLVFDTEMDKQKGRVQTRLYGDIPDQRYICFYPMNKRRGENVNWYTLSMVERRDLMRNHSWIGHKYHEKVTQIITGSIGLDNWEWGVSLHSDNALDFKKLIYEMRFDTASAVYAEFGPFYIGIHLKPQQLPNFLAGTLNGENNQ